ncbi:hypothetical protein MLD38_037840 [Melastoma candidum]|uniref:Uncharacterized protein n=1 Tax=Melastoma candidum TaxID=119954 RepID=A0ACB9LPE4_9MYRT|nr:hypothetical protein MLD38_037840 [Melastoma candidum]
MLDLATKTYKKSMPTRNRTFHKNNNTSRPLWCRRIFLRNNGSRKNALASDWLKTETRDTTRKSSLKKGGVTVSSPRQTTGREVIREKVQLTLEVDDGVKATEIEGHVSVEAGAQKHCGLPQKHGL